MAFKLCMLAASAASSIAGAVAMDYFAPQQGVPAPGGRPAAGGQPATTPSPQQNPQPRTNPGNIPNQPVNQNQPVNPANPTNQPGVVNPGAQPGGVNTGVQPGVVNPGAYQRPFAFASPAAEARYNENARRLVAMEQRLARSNADLTRRLGEARALTGERQTAATFDVLQQILKEQAAMNQYLVRARTTWTGDLEGTIPMAEDEYTAANEGAQPQPQTVNPSGGGTQPTTTTPAPR
jgi:hypothetical protein